MESVGQTMSHMNRARQFNYEDLVAQILADQEVAAFIKDQSLSEQEIRRSISKFNQYISERNRFLLGVQSLRAAKQSGKMYLKQNAIFWARRASGMAILILLFFHIGLFGKVQNGTYILFPFTTVKMVTQLLFVAAIFIHVFINIRPLLVSLGIISYKERRGDIYLILSVLLLFIAGAVILYYIGWQYL